MPKPNHFDRDGLPLNGADWDGAVVLRGKAMSDGAGVVENPRKGRPLRIVGSSRATARSTAGPPAPARETLCSILTLPPVATSPY